jgi:putative aldouronate transport system permease protein
MKRKMNFVDVIIIFVLCLMAFSCLIPILNTVAISFSDKTNAALGNVYLWPVNTTTSSYIEIIKDSRYFTAFGVSILRVVLGVSINIILSVFMAYPLSKDKKSFPARNIYMWLLVFTMLFNGGLVPTFLLVKSLNILDTIWALVLPGAVPVFSVIILMNFYKGIPKSLEEAALVDGANPLYILLRIMIPLSKASIATIALFSIVGHWNSFFDGKIYINTPAKQPLQTYIQSLTIRLSSEAMKNMTPEEIIRKLELSNLTFNSAKVVVSMIPILLIYPFLQKYFVTGLVMGAVKE